MNKLINQSTVQIIIFPLPSRLVWGETREWKRISYANARVRKNHIQHGNFHAFNLKWPRSLAKSSRSPLVYEWFCIAFNTLAQIFRVFLFSSIFFSFTKLKKKSISQHPILLRTHTQTRTRTKLLSNCQKLDSWIIYRINFHSNQGCVFG